MQLQPTNSQNKISPKLKQFQEELNSLLERYQYVLRPEVSYRPAGIVAILTVADRVPDKKSKKFKLSKKQMDKLKKKGAKNG